MHTHAPPQQAVIRMLQLSDPHLGAEPGDTLLGLDTDFSLAQVINLVQRERGDIDVLLATGDISSCGAKASYQRFAQMTAGLAQRSLWLPGNHDQLTQMQQAIGSGDQLTGSATVANWQVIMLNSTVAGQPGGCLAASELEFLAQRLEYSAQQSTLEHVLICLHHPLLATGSGWLDPQQLANSAAFFSVLDGSDQVRGVLWGHAHQVMEGERRGVKLLGAPSTCVQFAPDSEDFKLDRLNPGYRWLELHADGRIESQVCRVSGVEFTVDYDCAGY